MHPLGIPALQIADESGVACPVTWTPAAPVMVPPPATMDQVARRTVVQDLESHDFDLVKKKL